MHLRNSVKVLTVVALLFLKLATAGFGAAPKSSPSPSPVGTALLPAATHFEWRPTVEHVDLIPSRPKNSSELRVAAGVFEGYTFDPHPLQSMRLVLRDLKTGKETQYLLSSTTSFNGEPLKCLPEVKIGALILCAALPASLVLGKSVLAVLYWPAPFPDFPKYRGTDTIITLPR